MMHLDDALRDVDILGFDTAPIVYFVEAHPRYDALVTAIFERVMSGCLRGITSVVSLLEVLVVPLRKKQQKLAQEYRDLLLSSQHFAAHNVTAQVSEHAVQLRAEYGLRTPDAIQVAAALEHGGQAFLTNDRALQRVTEPRVLVLDDLRL